MSEVEQTIRRSINQTKEAQNVAQMGIDSLQFAVEVIKKYIEENKKLKEKIKKYELGEEKNSRVDIKYEV